MAYKGTTAGSSVGGANPPQFLFRGMSAGANLASTLTPIGIGLWVFGSTDTSSSPFTSNYFTDAKQLGMRQGDIVFCVGMTSTVASSQVLMIGTVGAVTTDGTQLSTFSFISST
jgi:hypothetical protein